MLVKRVELAGLFGYGSAPFAFGDDLLLRVRRFLCWNGVTAAIKRTDQGRAPLPDK